MSALLLTSLPRRLRLPRRRSDDMPAALSPDDMLPPERVAAILQYLRLTNVAIPTEPTRRGNMMKTVIGARNLFQWKAAATSICGFTAAQTSTFGSRPVAVENIMQYCPFR